MRSNNQAKIAPAVTMPQIWMTPQKPISTPHTAALRHVIGRSGVPADHGTRRSRASNRSVFCGAMSHVERSTFTATIQTA